MTRVLDLDAVLMNIQWRDNIHLELTVDVSKDLSGHLVQNVLDILTVELDLESDKLIKFLPKIDEIYGYEMFRSETTPSCPRNLDSEQSPSLKFMFVDGRRTFIVPASSQGDGTYLISINVTTFRNRREIPDGKWAIYPLLGDTLGPPAQFNLAKHNYLADFSRVFIYAANKEAYTVTFSLTENEVRPEIRVRTFKFNRTGTRNRLQKFRDLRHGVIQTQRKKILNLIYRVARTVRPKSQPTILFASEQRDDLQGNLRAVHDQIFKRGLNNSFRIARHFWIAKSRDTKTRLVQTIRIAQADYLVVDDYFPGLEVLDLDPSTTVIQAWHAGVGFKSVGYARFGNLGSPPRENAHRKYTWAIAGSKNLRPIYADVFGIEEKAIIPTGLPRIDEFISDLGRDTALKMFASTYPDIGDRKVILFAPTYRGRGIRDAYYDYSRIDFQELYELCGDKAVVGFRMHHFVTDPVPIPPEFSDRFIDLSHYPDGLGLLHSTDLLITDYSSIIYEYALLDRPMLFYAYDRDSYAATRGFQQEYDVAAPGKVCLSSRELMDAIRNRDFEQEKVTEFRKKNFDVIDTGASDRFIDWFFLGKMPKEFI